MILFWFYGNIYQTFNEKGQISLMLSCNSVILYIFVSHYNNSCIYCCIILNQNVMKFLIFISLKLYYTLQPEYFLAILLYESGCYVVFKAYYIKLLDINHE